jgi:transposase
VPRPPCSPSLAHIDPRLAHALAERHHDRYTWKRMHAIAWLAQGQTVRHVAAKLDVSRNTVWTWRALAARHGLEALLPRGPARRTELSPADLRRLQRAIAREKDCRVARRLRAVEMFALGLTISEIAAKLQCCSESVPRWRRLFLAHGVAGLRDKPPPGRPRK